MEMNPIEEAIAKGPDAVDDYLSNVGHNGEFQAHIEDLKKRYTTGSEYVDLTDGVRIRKDLLPKKD